MLNKVHRSAVSLLMAAVLSACAVKRPHYDLPAVPLPAEYRNSMPVTAGDELRSVPEAAALPLDVVSWWHSFGNPELDRLVDRALANNPDIRIATLRIAQAKARADQARAGRLPSVTAQALTAKQAPGGTVGSVPVGGDVHQSQRSYQAGVQGQWRVDLWGEMGALAESAEFQLWRAAFERDNVQRTLVASLASSYIEFVSLNDRLGLARETEAALKSTLATVERRVAVGDATLGELEQQRAAIFSLRATIPALEQQREEALNSVAFLVGTVPSTLALSSGGLDSLAVPTINAGLPSALLLRRPDVRAVEARLLSADADIDVARARLFPTLDLSAQIGYSSLFLSQMFQPQTLFWNMVASTSASIFDGGRRAKEEDFSQAIHEELVETYIRTIHQALREVESGLAGIRLLERRVLAQREAAEAARRAWEISLKVYAAGGLDYLGLLDAERTYHRHLDELLRMRMERYRAYINLFQALGGGGVSEPTPPGNEGALAAQAPQQGRSVAGPSSSPAGIVWENAAGRSVEAAWRVELPALYLQSTVPAVWRDLRSRYSAQLETRELHPVQVGRVEMSKDTQEAWYRLYVAPFALASDAEAFCRTLQADQQRCRVLPLQTP
ncbi:MAG: efflux transporter outer membrane subunit [Proteobacteria bacterium]|nr:efflux transporter outer membrane subunit [Pseudomonadota bacterium]